MLRGRRNREAVVEALLELVEGGDLKPTAKAIAERAGISRRSVFQHFADVESIYQAVVGKVAASVEPMLQPVDTSLPLPERMGALVARRRALFALLDPFARSARLREPFSTELAASRDRLTWRMVEQCRQAFAAEASGLEPTEAETVLLGVSVALSWAVWDYLRADVGLDEERALSTMSHMATGLLAGGDRPLTASASG